MQKRREIVVTARESFAHWEKREIDRRLNDELEGTFPASDPLKITRFSVKSHGAPDDTRRGAPVPKVPQRHRSIL